MKQFLTLLSIVAILATFSCTQGKTGGIAENKKKSHQADTGFTGIAQYKNGDNVTKQVELKNGIKDGITRLFYKGGAVQQEIPYVNGHKEGNAKWFYPDSKLFRVTPYENDTINGEQIQYYKDGKVKARIRYTDGVRVPIVDEYEMNGTKIIDYPHLVYRVNDSYNEKGIYKIYIEMSNMAEDVLYYRGDFTDGLVDLSKCEQLRQTATTAYLDLVKSEGVTSDSVIVIGAYLTPYGNRYYSRLAIPLPYKNLK